MLPQIEALLVVQDRDHQIQTLKKDLENIPRDAAAIKDRVMQATAELNTAKENVQQNELVIKKIDLDRKTRTNTIDKLTVQQFETSKNDEYAALGAEVTRYQDMVSELETQELESMEKLDDLASTLAAAKEKLTSIKEAMPEAVKSLTAKKQNLTTRISELTEERAILIKDIESSTLAIYDRVFSKKGNSAVSPLQDNLCGCCHMKVISDTISRTIAEKELSQCENCGCFLYSV